MATKWDLPVDPLLAVKVVDHETKVGERKLEMGFIGYIFGDSAEKPGNIASIILIVFVIMFGIELFFGPDSGTLTKKDALTLIGGFITLTLGYVFGRTTTAVP